MLTTNPTQLSSLSDEMQKKLSDKRWRMNNLYKIITTDPITQKSRLVTFKMNEAQEILFSETHPNYIIPKARQLGITTYHVIFMLDDVLFNHAYRAVLQADEREKMEKIFLIAQIAWREFPSFLKEHFGWQEVTDNKNTLRFNNDSSFVTTLSARSGTTDHLHISELSRIEKEYPDKVEEIRTGSIPSVVTGGRVTIESTVEIPEGYFAKLYNEGFDEKQSHHSLKDFKRFFFPWTMDKKYTLHNQTLYDNLPIHMREYQKQHNLSDEQVTWYYSTQKAYKFDDIEMKRQYPTTVIEAFSSSSNTFFDQENLDLRFDKDIEEPTILGDLFIYEEFVPGHRYAIGVDCAEGINKDSSTAVVIDFSYTTEGRANIPKVVARYANNNISPALFAYELRNIGLRYGRAIIAPERNSVGQAVIQKLKEIYPNIYTEVRTDRLTDVPTTKLGFLTTGASKPGLLLDIKDALKNDEVIIPDRGLLLELKYYNNDDYERIKFDPDVTKHSDLVMGFAIAWRMKNFATKSSAASLLTKNEDDDFDPHSMI